MRVVALLCLLALPCAALSPADAAPLAYALAPATLAVGAAAAALRAAAYAKTQVVTAEALGGVPRGSTVVELDAVDGACPAQRLTLSDRAPRREERVLRAAADGLHSGHVRRRSVLCACGSRWGLMLS